MRKALVKRGGQIIEVDVDDNHVNQLHKAQKGEEFSKPVYDEYGDEIMSSKHRNKRGKDFSKYRKYDPESGREYVEKQTFDPYTNRIEYSVRNKGQIFPQRGAYYSDAPNPFINVEQYVNPYRTDFNQQPTMLPGMQVGGEESKYPLNDQGEEIRYRKEFDRRGKRITKEKLVTPPNEEEGERGSTRYVKRVLDDSGQGRMISRPSGIDYFINPFRANFIGEPRDGSYIDYEINPNFNQQPRMFQMGGAPQEQMAQQQMPPQQEGQAQGSEQDQIMRLIQAYAQAMGISPEEIIQELQQMDPQEQKQAIDQMAQELQGGEQAQAPEQQMSPEQMMQMGGANNIYTPDTGTEQYAPDPSWYEGGDRVAAPGNVVSWPSFPEGGRSMRRNIPNGTREIIPSEGEIEITDILRVPGSVPRRTGTSTFYRNPSAPEQEYDDSSYDYEDDYNPVRRVPFFENLADRVGDGFDNVGDFFKKLKRRGGRRGRRMRGNGLLNCKPGTKCFKFQEGGDSQNDSPLDMLTPEYKNQYFADLTKQFGQINHDKAFMKDLQKDFQMFQAGGYITDVDGNQQYSLGHNFNFNKGYQLQQEANNRDKNANTGEAFWKLFGTAMNSAQKLKSGMSGIGGGGAKAPTSKPASAPVASATPTPTPAATTPAAPAPAAGAAPAATPAASGNPLGALSSILGGGGGGAAGALGGMDLSALAGFLRYGGSLPTAGDGGILGKILPAAAGIAGTMFAGPVGGIAAKTAVSGITGGGKGASGGGGGGFDPSALISIFAKYGGNLPRYQSNINTGQVSIFDKIRPDFVPHDPNFVPWANNNTVSSFKPSEHVYDFKGPSNQPDFQLIGKGLKEGDPDYEKIVLPPDQPDNSLETWRKQMKDNSAVTEDGKNWDPLKFNKEDIEKYNLDPTQNNITQKKEKLGFKGFMQATQGVGPATAGFLEAWGNRDKAIKAQNKADMALLSDLSSKANTPDMLDLGDYGTNVFMPKGNFRPNSNVPMGYNASEFGKYGMQVAKVGTQVQNPYMSNPYSHPEAILYGKPDPKVSNTLKPVKREDANLEAEIGEVAVTPAGPDGIPKFFKIGGKNHYAGGTPLSLPENTFIFSKTRSMIIKDPKILKELTGSTKPASPADLAKRFDYSDYIAVLQNENSDPVERKTAQMMVESMMYKLGQIAIIQEAKKGFPSGIPLVAVPYLEKAGIDPQMLLPQTQQEPQQEDPRMQQQMDPRMMQEQMEPMPEEMMMPPMARYGGSNLERYQTKGQVLTPEQAAAADQALGRIRHYGFRNQRGEGDQDAMAGYKAQIDSLYGNPMYDIKAKVDSLNNVYPTVRTKFTDVPWNQIFDTNKPWNKNLIYKQQNIADSNPEFIKKYFPEQMETLENKPNPYFKSYDYKKLGGTNIMGSPVLPRYQNGSTFTSSPSTPEKPNFAQQVLGPLFNYLPETEVAPENFVSSVKDSKNWAITSPQKGFADYIELDDFITSGKELGVDLTPVYNAYSGALTGIQKLKQGLINGSVPFDIYEKEKEALNKRIDAIKTELTATNNAIPNMQSSSYNPWSTANKIQDLEDILVEEKNGLNVKAVSLKKFRELQNNYSALVNEKKLLQEKLYDPNVDDLDKMSLNRKLKDLDLALYNENINVKAFGNNLIKNTATDYPVDDAYTDDLLDQSIYEDAITKGISGEKQPNPYKGGKLYTYKQYKSDYGFTTNTPSSTSNNVVPSSQMSADSTAKSTPTPVQVQTPVKTKTKSITNQSKPSKFKKVEGDDLNLF